MLLLCSLGLEEASLLAASTSGRHLPREGEQGLEMGEKWGDFANLPQGNTEHPRSDVTLSCRWGWLRARALWEPAGRCPCAPCSKGECQVLTASVLIKHVSIFLFSS